MWDRPTLKFYAKEQLRQYYWVAFAVCLVGGLLGGGSGSSSPSFEGSGISRSIPAMPDYMAGVVIVVVLIAFLCMIAFSIFVGSPIQVGLCSFFITAPWGDRRFTNLFSSFRSGRYLSIVKTMFFTNLYIFLWTLLFIVPGIIKSYEYRMVPYLISEYPYLTPDEAMRLSKEMTDGQKLDIWVLEFSFIGWYLLGMLALLIGVLFVVPYEQATYAQLYFALRQNATIPPPPIYPGYRE